STWRSPCSCRLRRTRRRSLYQPALRRRNRRGHPCTTVGLGRALAIDRERDARLQNAGVTQRVAHQPELGEVARIDRDALAEAGALYDQPTQNAPAGQATQHLLEIAGTRPGDRDRQRGRRTQLDLVQVVTEHREDLVGANAAEGAEIALVDPGEAGLLLWVP